MRRYDTNSHGRDQRSALHCGRAAGEPPATQALPFVVERPSVRRHQAELHARLTEVDEALALFQRRTVMVKADDD